MEISVRDYFKAIWSQLKGLSAAIRGKAPAQATEVVNAGNAADDISNLERAKVHAMLPSKHEIDCVRAYFRLIGLIMRYKRWMKPGEKLAPHFRRTMELFVSVEWQYAQCGFRPMMPLNKLFEISEEPEVVVAAGYVVRRLEGEEPVYFARAVMRQVEKLAAAKSSVVAGV